MRNLPIALLTDFGLEDHYVGSLKGVIHLIHPNVRTVDICHAVRPQNILEGAFILREVYPYFPKGTIFLAVVDPGVGSSRRAVCIRTSKGYLIGPDNGLLSLALEHESSYTARHMTNEKYFLKPVSATFHGRDVFAPVAAHLSKSDIFEKLGPRVNRITKIPIEKILVTNKTFHGCVIYVDRFGNAITNIHMSKLKKPLSQDKLVSIEIHRAKLKQIHRFFSEGTPGKLIAIWNSSGFLEFAVPNGSAEKRYQLAVGHRVQVRFQ